PTATATVDWAVAGHGGNPAVVADFQAGAFPFGTLTFAPGESVQVITVLLAGDTMVESDEDFRVTLSNASGAEVITATADGRVANDDSSVAIQAQDAQREEGDEGSTPFTFTITRTGYLGSAATASWAVTGSGDAPANASDFAGT